MPDLYPSDYKEWIALVTVLIPLLIAACAAAWKVLTYYMEWKSQQWARLQVLVGILYNKDFTHGGWAQIGAIREIEAMKVPQPAKRAILSGVHEHFSVHGKLESLKTEARNALSRNSRCWPKRVWSRWLTP